MNFDKIVNFLNRHEPVLLGAFLVFVSTVLLATVFVYVRGLDEIAVLNAAG